MSHKGIMKIIDQQEKKSNTKINFMRGNNSVLEFNVLTTKKADEILKSMSVDVDEFSGNPKIGILLKEKMLNIRRIYLHWILLPHKINS